MNKRRGLQRLQCRCGATVYLTWAQAERHGMPVCGCGLPFEPADYELALALGLEESGIVQHYRRRISSVWHGQAGPGRSDKLERKRQAAGRQLEAPETIVALELEQSRRDAARAARLAAIAPQTDPMPF